jgi:hypothetical protein
MIAAFACVVAGPALAGGARLTTGKALSHDVSPPLRDMAAAVVVEKAAVPDREVNPIRQPVNRPGVPDTVGRPDPLLQSTANPPGALASTPLPTLGFEGLSDDDNAAVVGGRIVPPDTNGDVGLTHYVQFINLIFAVYDKATGARVYGPVAGNTLWAGFGGPCQNNNDGDPIVLYDHLAHRWLFSQFSINEGIQCVALSSGENPVTSTYSRWAFVVSPGQQNDYPKIGLMPNAYYMTLRDFPSNDGDFASFVAMDRNAMLAGSAGASFVKFSVPCASGNCPDGVQPPHLEGPAPASGTPGVFSRAWDEEVDGPLEGNDGYRLWQMVPNFASPGSSTFSELPFVVAGGNFDSAMCGFFQRACVVQPSPGEKVDPSDELQMYREQYRHFASYDSIVINTTVDATGRNVAGIRWAELRNSGSGWYLQQDGTYGPADGNNRWLGSAAMDKNGNIALGYSVSSRKTFPSVRYTSRLAGDAPGTMPGGEVTLVAGSDVQTRSYNRWGDYSSMSVDPADDCTFWYTQEYQANDDSRRDFDFKTRIGSFKLAGCP